MWGAFPDQAWCLVRDPPGSRKEGGQDRWSTVAFLLKQLSSWGIVELRMGWGSGMGKTRCPPPRGLPTQGAGGSCR